MINIFSNLLENCMEVFMDDFMVYGESFNACLENLSRILTRCIDTNLVLNFEVDKAKVDIIASLSYPASVQEQDRHAIVQAVTERYGIHLRPALLGGLPRAEEETYLHTDPLDTELGVSVRAYV
ncbi:hypothetical protein CR513_03877, partial [Mucuna pruriens]